MKRTSGVLLPVFSLPGAYSCGSFGKGAYELIDFLKTGGFSFWQILPLCIPDGWHSPYSSFSSFLGNPFFIDPEQLAEEGLITAEELSAARQASPWRCEYERLEAERFPLLKKAAERVPDRSVIREFAAKHPDIEAGCRFMALKEANAGVSWNRWTVTEPDPETVFAWQFTQYVFRKQWDRLHAYAAAAGIRIIGDLPFYVSYDSCDVWADQAQFQLSESLSPLEVAGVPPDYFSEDGQLWGNPIYDWDVMEETGFQWWRRRAGALLDLFDGLRLDHFRAAADYWSIPCGADTARSGAWKTGPGRAFIDALKAEADGKLIIAENLGLIDERVYELLEYSGFPGMAVLQFGFDGDPGNVHLPHNYSRNLVAYPGTHDNNTLLGFMWELPQEIRARVLEYVGFYGADWNQSYECILRCLMRSAADTVIFPLQDLLGYGADTRINTPGTTGNNWEFRLTEEQLQSAGWESFRRMNRLYGR